MFTVNSAAFDPRTVHISNMTSPRTGNTVSNQFVIDSSRYSFFQSYASLVAVYDKNERSITLGHAWNYSKTTLKYLKMWLESDAFNAWAYIRDEFRGRTLSETIRKAIDAGVIEYDCDIAGVIDYYSGAIDYDCDME